MKNRILILMILISGAFLYPFGCEAQTKTLPVDPEGCDTIFVEDPAAQKCADDLADATSIIVVKTAQVANLDTKVASLNGIILNKDAEIKINLNVISGLNQDLSIQNDINAAQVVVIERRDVTIDEMQVLIDAKPIIETVYVEKDSITVGGKVYKVSEIDVILPTQSIDTVYLNICFTANDPDKLWLHSGDINVYPHVINFPTKELSMTSILFTKELTDDMKKYQTKFTVKRIRNHEDATTKYENITVDPSEYLPN